MGRLSRTAHVLAKQKTIKVTGNTPHINVKDIEVGETYQTHVTNIVKVMSIKDGYAMLRNISLSCNQRVELKNCNFVKKF
jgi:hypothetical protein